MTEIEPTKEKIVKENKLLSTNITVEMQNQNVEGLITYSMDQQIFKFKVNSGNNQELWGVYVDFKSNHNKWTIDAILQHMGFYSPTENPNVMMRENHNTKSSEYLLIYHDDLYIVSTTTEEMLHILQDKSIFIYMVNIHVNQVEQIFVNSRNIWKSYLSM